jgi:cytochrome c oxidase assembly protein subunit 11
MTSPRPSKSAQTKNAQMALICVVVFAAMTGAAFAAVPLYKAFCQATGFDGTVSDKAAVNNSKVIDRSVDVRFDGNVRDMPWTFAPEQVKQTLKLGETKLAYFKATNTGKTPVTGRALFNVSPETAGAHFHKIQCFCFDNQTIQPGQTVEFPVVYFVDPGFATDPETRGYGEITLSYTFYEATAAPPGQKPA